MEASKQTAVVSNTRDASDIDGYEKQKAKN